MTSKMVQYTLSADAMLTNELKTKARKELHEKEDEIPAHVISLKRWVKSMGHLTCPDDDRIYIAFLRHAKYDHSRAQARMDNFATLRSSPNSPTQSWFDRLPKDDPRVKAYLNQGIHIPIGFLDDGTYLMIIRMGSLNTDLLPLKALFGFATTHIDRIVQDPRIQICGLRVLFDMTDLSSKTVTDMNIRKNGKEITKLFQEGYPIRVKSFIYYNEPAMLDFVLKIMMHWMKPKMKERVILVKNDINKAYNKIPGLKTVMPKEYGGENRSMKELLEERNLQFMYNYGQATIWDGMTVDEAKRPDTAKNYMSKYEELDERVIGTAGTYVALTDRD